MFVVEPGLGGCDVLLDGVIYLEGRGASQVFAALGVLGHVAVLAGGAAESACFFGCGCQSIGRSRIAHFLVQSKSPRRDAQHLLHAQTLTLLVPAFRIPVPRLFRTFSEIIRRDVDQTRGGLFLVERTAEFRLHA